MAVTAAGAQACWPHRVALEANLTPRCLVRMRKFCCRTCCKTTSASFTSTVSTVRAFVSEKAVQCQGAAAADLLQTSMFICCLGSICAPAGYSMCGLNVKQDTGVGAVHIICLLVVPQLVCFLLHPFSCSFLCLACPATRHKQFLGSS